MNTKPPRSLQTLARKFGPARSIEMIAFNGVARRGLVAMQSRLVDCCAGIEIFMRPPAPAPNANPDIAPVKRGAA